MTPAERLVILLLARPWIPLAVLTGVVLIASAVAEVTDRYQRKLEEGS